MTTLPELNLLIEIIAEGRPNRPGTIITPNFLTIHNTDNDDRGAGAKAHSGFVRNTGYYILRGERHYVSWHFSVDDQFAIQQLPMDELAFHAKGGNAKSLAIEICMNRDIDQPAADDRAALLVAALMKVLNIKIDHVVTHKKWTGKNCPSKLLDNRQEGSKWRAFKTRISEFATELAKPGAPSLLEETKQVSIKRGSRQKFAEATDARLLDNDIDHLAVRDQMRRTTQ